MSNYKGIVSIETLGGLGNQLFKIATVIEYAKKYNKKIVLKERSEGETNNNHENIDYNILLKNTKNVEILNDKEFKKINFKNVINEEYRMWKKHDIPYYKNNLLLLGGYQSPFNFSKKTVLELTNNIYSYNNNYKNALKYYKYIQKRFDNYNDNDYVFIHIRRGDFNDGYYRRIINLSYILKGLKILNGLNKVLIIFSDDINWCKERLKINNKQIFVDSINDRYVELSLMSLIVNGIVYPESTYSFWGGLMGKKTKKIIASNYDYKNNEIIFTNEYNERYPKEWIVLDKIIPVKKL